MSHKWQLEGSSVSECIWYLSLGTCTVPACGMRGGRQRQRQSRGHLLAFYFIWLPVCGIVWHTVPVALPVSACLNLSRTPPPQTHPEVGASSLLRVSQVSHALPRLTGMLSDRILGKVFSRPYFRYFFFDSHRTSYLS